jgi:hypothetical protein
MSYLEAAALAIALYIGIVGALFLFSVWIHRWLKGKGYDMGFDL